MKILHNLAKTSQQWIVGMLTVLPLLIITPASLAETDRSVAFSQAELDQMLAPVALYPDTILSQVLIASTYPLEIIQADRWVRSNSDLKAEDALKFAEKKDWDPSVKALVAFPDILKRMSDDVDWTQRLGDAFLSDESSVMDTVQRLRKRAYASGNLDKTEHLRVAQEDNTIVIEPAEERVVYVPVYDTRVVYGNWWWPDYPPVYWHYPSSYTYVSGFYWGTSIYVGPSYYYSSCHWRDRRVVVVDRYQPYYNQHHFYTGRSIVTYEGSREWRHDPVHRHGVAYYNNDLRTTYGSRHESYQNDRDYREHYRDLSRFRQSGDNDQNTRVIRSHQNDNRWDNDSRHLGEENTNNLRNYDRSAEVRDRLNRSDDANAHVEHNNANLQRDFNNSDRGNRTTRTEHLGTNSPSLPTVNNEVQRNSVTMPNSIPRSNEDNRQMQNDTTDRQRFYSNRQGPTTSEVQQMRAAQQPQVEHREVPVRPTAPQPSSTQTEPVRKLEHTTNGDHDRAGRHSHDEN